MKIALLSPANVIHSTRWANGLAESGHEVHLISIHPLGHRLDPRVALHLLPVRAPWGYALSTFSLRALLRKIQPEILNAHYATGYGLLARLSRFRPCMLSVWGSDVYDFPGKSRFHRSFLRANLGAATAVGSTSHCMARVVLDIKPDATVHVTSFGIDVERFQGQAGQMRPRDAVVIGTVKTLAGTYGIDVLLRAFALAREQLAGEMALRLEIVGGGPDLEELACLADALELGESVHFAGKMPHDQVPAALSRFDIYAALSRLESFGVAALEASACELPIVVSDAQGLAEVTLDGKSGFVVPKEDAQAAARAFVTLARNEALRKQMGQFGRMHVIQNYSWSRSLEEMLLAYRQTISDGRQRMNDPVD